MVLKKGRFGQFFACTGYPDCKTTKQIGGRSRRKPMCRSTRSARKCGKQPGAEVRALRRVHGLQQLPEVQVRQAEDHRREVPEVPRARSSSALQARQDVLRLQPLSRLRFRRLGQADPGEVSGMRQSLPDREVAEGGPVAQCPNPECKYKRELPKPENVEELAGKSA